MERIVFVFLWCVSAHLQKLDTHQERVSHYKKHFTKQEINNFDFSRKMKDTTKFEKTKSLYTIVFELTSIMNFYQNVVTRTFKKNNLIH